MFPFVFQDTLDDSFIFVQNVIGIIPLYTSWGLDNSIWFASEMKPIGIRSDALILYPSNNYEWY